MNAGATQQQAAEALQHYFHQQVAEAMPKAIRASLLDAQGLGHWLAINTLHKRPCYFGPLEAGDIGSMPSLSVATLLVLLMDRRQPAEVLVAVRDALVGHYLADEDVQALAIAQANLMARKAVQALAHRADDLRRAEVQSLYGDEHGVTGMAPVVLPEIAVAAMDDTAGVAR